MKLSHFFIPLGLTVLSAFAISAKDEAPSYNLSRAMDEVQQGNPQDALTYLDKEIAENPKNGLAYLIKAAIRNDNAEYGEARNAVEAALKHLPKKDKEKLSAAYDLRGRLLAIEGDTIAAYSDLTTAIKLDPTNEEAYEKRAQLLFEQQRYDESDADYRRLAELNPGGVSGRMGLGRNAYARGDYGTAIEQYSRIITLYPDYSSGYSFRAQAYLIQEDYLKAIDDICKALEIDSDAMAVHLMFNFPPDRLALVTTKLKGLSTKHPNTGVYELYTGYIYGKNRMFAAANAALERSFAIDAHAVILEQISENYSEMGDYANALAYMERAMQMNPDDIALLGSYADILGESGDVDGAIAKWSEYIQNNPDYCAGYYRRGFFEDNSGRTEEALADYEMAIMLAPDYAYPYLGKGDMLAKLGRQDEAMEAYRNVVQLDTVPSNSSCAMYALLALGRRDEAVAFMDKVIENDSIDPGNYYDAACFTCRIGDNQKALDYLRTAFEKGFRRFWLVRTDDDLNPLHNLPEFEALIKEYEEKTAADIRQTDSDEPTEEAVEPVEIPFTPTAGVVKVSCTINDLPLNFIFDTGASTVSLSMLEANFMMKNGYLKPSDIVGTGTFIDAEGDITEGTVINLRQINFGGLRLNNVRASVVRNQKAPLLLGQTVLGRLGSIEIDNQNKKLIIKPNSR